MIIYCKMKSEIEKTQKQIRGNSRPLAVKSNRELTLINANKHEK